MKNVHSVMKPCDKLTDMTGEVYARVNYNFCPMCGRMRDNATKNI